MTRFSVLRCDSKQRLFVLMLVFYICLLGLNSFVNAVFGRTSLDSALLYGIYFLCIAVAIPRVFSSFSLRQVLVTVIVLLAVLIGLMRNHQIVSTYAKTMLLTAFPAFFLGSSLDDFSQMRDLFRIASKISTVFACIYLVCTLINGGYTHDMTAAYSYLPTSVILLFFAFEERKPMDLIFAIVGVLMILIYGVRGPMLVLAICLFVLVIRYMYSWRVMLFALLTIIAAVVILATPLFDIIIRKLSEVLAGLGMKNVILSRILEGSLTESEGRERIASGLMELVRTNPVFGAGIFADRAVTTYAHNFVLEVWTDFGLIFGTIFVILYFAFVIRAFRKSAHNRFLFGIYLTVASLAVGQLMFSSSYLESQPFFLMLGMIMNDKLLEPRVPLPQMLSMNKQGETD